MIINVNGKNEEIKEGIDILSYLVTKKLNPDTVVVEYNHSIVKKEFQHEIFLKENDKLEILRFVGGG